jgi:inorganic pyrophosphatase
MNESRVRSDLGNGKYDVVIETPKGSRNKFDYEPEHQLFRLGKQLPAGAVFPYDFGFIPRTLGEDGDPLDVIVLLDSPTFPGCLVKVRIVAVIEAEQSSKDRGMISNPRFIGIATKSVEHRDIRHASDLPPTIIDDIAHFFVAYNEGTGKEFRIIGQGGRRKANEMIRLAYKSSRRRS